MHFSIDKARRFVYTIACESGRPTQSVSIAMRVHPFPFRTRKLSSSVLTILGWKRPGKIRRCRHKLRAAYSGSYYFYDMDNSTSKIVHLPDMDYIRWMNLNKKLLDEIVRTNQIPTQWLSKGSNKKYLVRYFREMGYTIHIS